MLKLISEAPRSMDTKNIRGETPLMIALQMNKRRFVEILLRSPFDPHVVLSESIKVGYVHIAAATMDATIVSELITKGGKVDAQDSLGNTPLHYAVANRNFTAAEILLKLVCWRCIIS